jgi:hypothetical protein
LFIGHDSIGRLALWQKCCKRRGRTNPKPPRVIGQEATVEALHGSGLHGTSHQINTSSLTQLRLVARNAGICRRSSDTGQQAACWRRRSRTRVRERAVTIEATIMMMVVINVSCRDKVGWQLFVGTLSVSTVRISWTLVLPRSTRARRSSIQSSILCMVTSEDHRGRRPSVATFSDRDISCFIVSSAG